MTSGYMFLFSLSDLSSIGSGILMALAGTLYVTLTVRGLMATVRHG
ncbi:MULTISPECIES: hypothetical protein [Agrobacterium]|nr:hypothetical protein At1D1108_31240 [Agrobacterium tumefaciens]NSY08124.1 hypothetical protein [Agrobacterium tumefaciens]NSY91905.1 hypothetical protein [Agrobacterium tumefaciens]NSZ07941.1 hypothetical protein [Agrobacterium tumefaciens]